MSKKLILGILPYQSANAALDNLAEAEFENVSVIMQDTQKARQLANDTGPLQGIDVNHIANALKKYGFPQSIITSVDTVLQQGTVLVAFTTTPQTLDGAKEMLHNVGALQIASL